MKTFENNYKNKVSSIMEHLSDGILSIFLSELTVKLLNKGKGYLEFSERRELHGVVHLLESKIEEGNTCFVKTRDGFSNEEFLCKLRKVLEMIKRSTKEEIETIDALLKIISEHYCHQKNSMGLLIEEEVLRFLKKERNCSENLFERKFLHEVITVVQSKIQKGDMNFSEEDFIEMLETAFQIIMKCSIESLKTPTGNIHFYQERVDAFKTSEAFLKMIYY